METRQWFNPHQPQTLQTAALLLYLNAAIALLNGVLGGGGGGFIFLPSLAGIAAGYGIAQERKWGYWLGCVVAIIPLALSVLFILGDGLRLNTNTVINLMFEIVLVVLLFHPMTRSYTRIWFKK